MKLSLTQTKELLERVEKQLLEKKINLQEDGMRYTDSGGSGEDAPPTPTFGGLTAARKKETPEHRKKALKRDAELLLDAERSAKQKMPEDIRAVIEKIANVEEVTKEEIKNLDLSSQPYSDIIKILQSYARGVFGLKL